MNTDRTACSTGVDASKLTAERRHFVFATSSCESEEAAVRLLKPFLDSHYSLTALRIVIAAPVHHAGNILEQIVTVFERQKLQLEKILHIFVCYVPLRGYILASARLPTSTVKPFERKPKNNSSRGTQRLNGSAAAAISTATHLICTPTQLPQIAFALIMMAQELHCSLAKEQQEWVTMFLFFSFFFTLFAAQMVSGK